MPIFRILGGNSSSNGSSSRSSFMGGSSNRNSSSNANSNNNNNNNEQRPRGGGTYPGLRLQSMRTSTASAANSTTNNNVRTSTSTSTSTATSSSTSGYGGGGGLFTSMRNSVTGTSTVRNNQPSAPYVQTSTTTSTSTPYTNSTSTSTSNTRTRSSTSTSTSSSNSNNTTTTTNNSSAATNTCQNPATSRPGAYAVTRSTITSGMASQVYRVTVPPGVQQGAEFTVHAGNRRVRVRCPLSSRPGHSLQITLPPEPITTHKHLASAPLTRPCSIIADTRTNSTTSSSSSTSNATEYEFPGRSDYNCNSERISGSGGAITGARTSTGGAATGGYYPMTSEVVGVNRTAALGGKQAQTYLVTIPPAVYPGMQFTVNANGQRFMVTCPPDAGPNRKVRIVPPTPTPTPEQQEVEEPCAVPKTQVFEVIVPSGVRPNQPFTLMANGQRVLVTCPPNVAPGQKIRFQLPVPAGAAGSCEKEKKKGIQLSYTDDSGSSGWCRTIRVTDMKFQWVRVDNDKNKNVDDENEKKLPPPLPPPPTSKINDMFNLFSTVSTTNTTPQDQQQQQQQAGGATAVDDTDDEFTPIFDFGKAAYVRKIQYLEGNDARMRTGSVTLVPASDKDAVVDSKLIDHNYHGTQQTKTLLSYLDIANIQTKTLDEKIEWLNKSVYEELYTPWEKGHVKIVIRRHSLLSDSVDAIMALSRDDMRKRWRFEFLGEPGIEAGGLTREWFQLVTEQLFDPDFGLWLSSNNNQMSMTINGASHISCPDDHLIYFRFLGRVMGRALFDRQLIKGHMVRHLYKHLLGWPITFADLEAQDEEYYNSLKKFTTMEDLSVMCLDFTITEETLGVRNDIELIEGGNMKEVTKDNVNHYLEANLKYRMLNRTKPQITELLLGFFDIIPEPALTVLNPNELELILCGLPTIDMEDWITNTKYSGYYESKGRQDQVVTWFWDVVQHDFDQEMKARLLQFVTGTSGVPPRGFAVLQGNDGNIKKFCLHGCSRDTYVYPRAHTCFNRLDVPNYATRAELKERLTQAVSMTYVGFDME